MAFQPCRHVGEQGEAGGVRLGEAVLAEALDLIVNLVGEFAREAALEQAGAELVADTSRWCRARRQAPIARRNWSASPGVKPAATIASRITCS